MNVLHATPEPGWDQLRPIIDEVMDELNEHDREAVLLRFFENHSLAEIGAKFSLSPDAARMRIDRALDKLRVLLSKRGIASTSVALAAIFASQSGAAAPVGLVARIVANVFSPVGVATAATFGIWKILMGFAIGSLGTGLIVYQAMSVRPPASSSSAASLGGGARQNPIDPPAPAGGSGPVADHPGPGPSSPSWVEALPPMSRSDMLERMNKDPRYRAAMIALARSHLEFFYGPLFKNLNLSPARLEKFKDLLIEKGLVANDIYETLGQLPIHGQEYRAAFEQLDMKLSADVDDKIQAFLTAPEFAQFADYSEDFDQWTKVNEAARILQSTDTPLTDEQAKLLVVFLRDGRPKDTELWNPNIPQASGIQPLTIRILPPMLEKLEKAGGILSPQQIDALRQRY